MSFARHTEGDFTPEMREHPERHVPPGTYCYTRVSEPEATGRRGGPVLVCPFWDAEQDMPEQGYGYCWLDHTSDWGCSAEELDAPWDPASMLDGYAGTVPEGWAGRTYREWVRGYSKAFDDGDEVLGEALLHGLRLGDGLLWDQCKGCGINDDWDEE